MSAAAGRPISTEDVIDLVSGDTATTGVKRARPGGTTGDLETAKGRLEVDLWPPRRGHGSTAQVGIKLHGDRVEPALPWLRSAEAGQLSDVQGPPYDARMRQDARGLQELV